MFFLELVHFLRIFKFVGIKLSRVLLSSISVVMSLFYFTVISLSFLSFRGFGRGSILRFKLRASLARQELSHMSHSASPSFLLS
jgi:hypothetical protein